MPACDPGADEAMLRSAWQLLSQSIDGDHHGSPLLAHRLRNVSLSVHILNKDDLADADDAGLAVARRYLPPLTSSSRRRSAPQCTNP
jgi:hypothetical protein